MDTEHMPAKVLPVWESDDFVIRQNIGGNQHDKGKIY